MPIKFSDSVRSLRSQAIIDAMDAGTGNASIKFYTAPQPSKGAVITTEILIGSVECSSPSSAVSNGVLSFNSINDDISADADGDIAWARCEDSDGNFIFDADCGVSGSGAVFIFNTIVARIGGVIQVLSGSLTEGNN